MREQELIIFRDLLEDRLFSDFVYLMENFGNNNTSVKEKQTKFYDCFNKLTEFAAQTGVSGNLWHNYLVFLLLNSENTYSKAAEGKGSVEGDINRLVLSDLSIIRELYDFDLSELSNALELKNLEYLTDYKLPENTGIYNHEIRTAICGFIADFDKASSPEDMKLILNGFYGKRGAGQFGLHNAFRVLRDNRTDTVKIVPITGLAPVSLDDLVGYDSAKKQLIENTDAFVGGNLSNNCLLYGDAGTGKSTAVKALANMYFSKGLRVIEIYKHQIEYLNAVIDLIKDRNYKFVLFMDDLSFEEFETDYKYLKAVIEGGIEKKPDNVLIYATSNRRHLINEKFSERSDDEVHLNDTMQEKLSLYDRFGITVYFGSPGQKEYDNIVLTLAERNGISIPKEELISLARRWELNHGGKSGRCAEQFIQYIMGRSVND
ncbi:MAG: ATP-binding protein [Lachnospiraceae bacterium]|nr:ATP-binding protein [Lachnospiraceae bacterium]